MRCLLPLLLGVAGCGVPYDVPAEPPDAGQRYPVSEAWRLVREEMVRANACFAARRTYCLTDRGVLDDAIQLGLDTHFHSRMPLNERWLEELTDDSRGHWSAAMKSRHRKRVESLVAANWQSPHRERRRGRVDIELFVPPGELSTEKGQWRIASDYVVGEELMSTELARQLDHYRSQHPQVPVVRLLIDIPLGRGAAFRRWDVRHQLSSDRVLLVDPTDPVGAWVSERLGPQGFVPYLNGLERLDTSSLERCALGDGMNDPPDCAVHPPFNPTKKRRRPHGSGGRVSQAGWTPEGDGDGDD